MALIDCEDCNSEYSDKAPACPQCGCPSPAQAGQVHVIEQTSKKWKCMQLAGGLVLFFSFVSCTASCGTQTDEATGAYLFLAGTGLFIGGKVGGWWYHA